MYHQTYIKSSAPPGVTDSSALIASHTVTSLVFCLFICTNNKRCAISIMDGNKCNIYQHITNNALVAPEGASVYKPYMGEITVKTEKKTIVEAEKACREDGGRLAMPKTQEGFDAIAAMLEHGKLYIVGLTNPSGDTFIYLDGVTAGTNGFTFPREPQHLIDVNGISETVAVIFYSVDHSRFDLGDVVEHHEDYFICQSL